MVLEVFKDYIVKSDKSYLIKGYEQYGAVMVIEENNDIFVADRFVALIPNKPYFAGYIKKYNEEQACDQIYKMIKWLGINIFINNEFEYRKKKAAVKQKLDDIKADFV